MRGIPDHRLNGKPYPDKTLEPSANSGLTRLDCIEKENNKFTSIVTVPVFKVG